MITLSDCKRPLKGVPLVGALGCLWLASTAYGAPAQSTSALLQCHVTYGGSTQILEVRPVSDPYPVPSVDIGGRFRFKAVMVGQVRQIESIAIYVYLDTARQPLLIQWLDF
ncbi:MAG: hypothetical protein ACK53K_07125 [Burkholderiales bacterium]|jgi:hypothetical protein